MEKLLLVDFENIQQIDLGQLDEYFHTVIFVGCKQKNIPIELVADAQKLGNRLEWIQVEGNGSNALDFYIACHLGRIIERSPNQHCIILSRDKGFDPLLKYLNQLGLKCKRINSLLELKSKTQHTQDPNYKRVIEQLQKSEKKSRPRKRSTLSTYISARFQKKLSQAEIDQIIDTLFAEKMISEDNKIISYAF